MIVDGADGSATLTEDQIKEVINAMKVEEEPISDAIKCESGPHHYRCYEDEKTNTSTDTVLPDK